MNEIWGRLPRESSKAYEAFLCYLNLSPKVRSVDRAFRVNKNLDHSDSRIRADAGWRSWSIRNKWLERALAYDDHNFQQDLEKWEKRKEQARERDWEQAEKLRAIVDGALPHADQFFQRRVGQPQGGVPTVVDQQGNIIRQGTPAQVIVTVAFDVRALTGVLSDASKLQRLANNESTENFNNLTGAALDQAIKRALEELDKQSRMDGDDDDGETGVPTGDFGEDDEPETEGEADDGAED